MCNSEAIMDNFIKTDDISKDMCEMIDLPKEIKDIVGNQAYVRNNTGMSGSDVLIFPEYVLKIQRHTSETDNERDIVAWLNGRIRVPEIPVYCVENGKAYTLMTRVKGKMLCDEEYLKDPSQLISLAAIGLKKLWAVDVSQCSLRTSRLEERLKEARWNVENGLVDMENVEPETFGKDGFANPEELLIWLEQNRPEEDIVLTHGDFCLPNIFIDQNEISGFIDLGKMGPADRWQDLAIVLRSLKHNFSGKYGQAHSYFDFKPEMLMEKLGIEMDTEKNRYYLLLDELF